MKYIILLLITFLQVQGIEASTPIPTITPTQTSSIAFSQSAKTESKSLSFKKKTEIRKYLEKYSNKDGIILILLFIILPLAIGVGVYFLLTFFSLSTLIALIAGLLVAVLSFLGIAIYTFSNIRIC